MIDHTYPCPCCGQLVERSDSDYCPACRDDDCNGQCDAINGYCEDCGSASLRDGRCLPCSWYEV